MLARIVVFCICSVLTVSLAHASGARVKHAQVNDLKIIFVDVPESEEATVIVNLPQASAMFARVPGLRFMWMVHNHEGRDDGELKRGLMSFRDTNNLRYTPMVKPGRTLYQFTGVKDPETLEEALAWLAKVSYDPYFDYLNFSVNLLGYEEQRIEKKLQDDFYTLFGVMMGGGVSLDHKASTFSTTPGDYQSLGLLEAESENDYHQVHDPSAMEIIVAGSLEKFDPEQIKQVIKKNFRTESKIRSKIPKVRPLQEFHGPMGNWVEMEGLQDKHHMRIAINLKSSFSFEKLVALSILANMINADQPGSLGQVLASVGVATKVHADTHHRVGAWRMLVLDLELTKSGFEKREYVAEMVLGYLAALGRSSFAQPLFESAKSVVTLPNGSQFERNQEESFGFDIDTFGWADFVAENSLAIGQFPEMKKLNFSRWYRKVSFAEFMNIILPWFDTTQMVFGVSSPDVEGIIESEKYRRKYALMKRNITFNQSRDVGQFAAGCVRALVDTPTLSRSYEDH